MKQISDGVFAQVRDAVCIAESLTERSSHHPKILAALAALDTAQPVQVNAMLVGLLEPAFTEIQHVLGSTLELPFQRKSLETALELLRTALTAAKQAQPDGINDVYLKGYEAGKQVQPEPDAHAKFAKVPMADARTHGPQIIKVDIEFPGIYASVNLNGFTLASHELPSDHKKVVLGYRVQHLPEVWFGLGYRHGDVYWLGATGLEPNYHCLNADQIVIWRKVDMPFSFDEGRQDTNEYLQYRYILGDAAWETEETSKADRLAKQAQPERAPITDEYLESLQDKDFRFSHAIKQGGQHD